MKQDRKFLEIPHEYEGRLCEFNPLLSSIFRSWLGLQVVKESLRARLGSKGEGGRRCKVLPRTLTDSNNLLWYRVTRLHLPRMELAILDPH